MTPYFDHPNSLLKQNGVRRVLLWFRDDVHDRALDARNIQILHEVAAGARKDLERSVRQLRERGHCPTVPEARLRCGPQYHTVEDPPTRQEVDEELQCDSSLRVALLLSDLIESSENYADRPAASHLVEFSVRDGVSGWQPTPGPASALVHARSEQARRLVHDVLLDIHMMHALSAQHGLRGYSPSEVSKAKVRLLEELGISTVFGAVHAATDYVSLASAVDAESPFGEVAAAQYASLWKQLLTRKPFSMPIAEVHAAFGSEGLIRVLKRYHKRFDQLSVKRLKKKLRTLHPGKYWLALARDRPRPAKLRAVIARELGGTEFHVNKWRIIDSDAAVRLRPWEHWISFYPFVLPDPSETKGSK